MASNSSSNNDNNVKCMPERFIKIKDLEYNEEEEMKDWIIKIKDERKIKDEGREGKGIAAALAPKKLIPRVPPRLRKIHSQENCFDPAVVSLGPYHHCNSDLKQLEDYKIKAVRLFIEDLNDVETFCLDFKHKAIEAKNYYEESSVKDVSDEDFTRMMFVDGCFILCFIHDAVNPSDLDEWEMSEPDKAMVERDVMLLENQIPFIILQELASVKSKTETQGASVKSKTETSKTSTQGASVKSKTETQGAKFFDLSAIDKFIEEKLIKTPWHWTDFFIDRLFPFIRKKQSDSFSKDKPAHLLDRFRKQLLGKHTQLPVKYYSSHWYSPRWCSFRRVQELKEAGIMFHRSGSNQLNDIKFESYVLSGKLKLPPIVIDYTTKDKFLNMIAYELSPANMPQEYGITSYVCLMDSLIDREEDVIELRSKDILLNSLGSDKEVADLFNVLSTRLTPDPRIYAQTRIQIESHCKNPFKVSMATLYHTYFSTPWVIISFIAAVILLFLTMVQTFYTVKPYWFPKPKSQG